MIAMEYVITFKNTNLAIQGERHLLDAKLQVTVMPLPSQIRAGCGICLRVPEDEIQEALEILKAKKIEEIGLYSRTETEVGFKYAEVTSF